MVIEDVELAAKESKSIVGDIMDDFGYNWKFVKPRAAELKDHFTLETMYQGKPVSGWVKKFPGWEDRQREVQVYVRNHASRSDANIIHTIWDIKTLVSKYGAETAIRELKKRCDAGAIVGCSLYLNMSTHLIDVALRSEAKDPAFRAPSLDLLESAEGERWVKRIEDLHEKYPETKIPKNEIEDLKDEFTNELERRAGRMIPRLPQDASKEDIKESKRIAERLGGIVKPAEEKPKEKESAPVPQKEKEVPRPAAVPEPIIPVPEKPGMQPPRLDLMRAEIEAKMARMRVEKGRGELKAGEGSVETNGMKKEIAHRLEIIRKYKAGSLKLEEMSFHELQYLIQIYQNVGELRGLLSRIDTLPNIAKFDKEMLKEEISKRIQVLIEQEERALNPPAPEKFRESTEPKIVHAALISCKDYHEYEIKCKGCKFKTTTVKCVYAPAMRETGEVREAPQDYSQWNFGDFEGLLPGLEDIEDLEELLERVDESRAITVTEIDTLRNLIKQRMAEVTRGYEQLAAKETI